ncbi:DSBA family oxidoreductase [Talaromyces proteolyticus]|uniref:Glutathione S-transferase kappa 1 n=1 Tax=Talaromyces proteolyticus TaxID=1131652 RepID=A0AAD4Q346_9EURO|nr:DSBA family oxidoreductase [Talaromyces proteolyticus]KAH8701046.1 DSBA family oxidoreductase [Talaromyces proteolyticus]
MGGIINVYLDCVSPYSQYAFLHLLRNRSVLASHGIRIDIHPVFLGGINVGSGNKPPWTLPAKAKHGETDRRHASRYYRVPNSKPPPFFPILSLLPQRAITYIKHAYPPATFEKTFDLYWKWLFDEHHDISKPEILAELLRKTPEPGFTAQQVDEIMAAANDKKWKDALLAKTQEALDQGAFGAPWFYVVRTGEKGEVVEECGFFGSDRFHYIWQFLEVPFDDIKIKPGNQSITDAKGKL